MRRGDGGGPVARFEPAELLARVAAAGGPGLTFDGWCPGGEQGAAYVLGPDGRRSVLHWLPGHDPRRAPAVAVREAARAAGVPVPVEEAAIDLDDGMVTVQELVVGAPAPRLTVGLLDQLLVLLDRRRGVFAGDPRADAGMALHLLDDGPGFCFHGPMRAAGGRAARLLGWIEEVGRTYGPPLLPGPDAVHFDHHPGNVLVDGDGRVTALIDWGGAAVGDSALDLVTLRFGVVGDTGEPEAAGRLDELLAELPDHRRRPAWAHQALRSTDWSLRFHPSEVDRWLDVAEAGLD